MINLTNQSPLDVFVKQEGFADVRFLTEKAKEVAHKLGIPNSWKGIADEEHTWSPKNPEGRYKCGLDYDDALDLIKDLEKEGLIIESEIES